MATLQIRKLVKTFGTGETAVKAVRSIDLDSTAGEVVLVMGPSGSGKTTLLLMMGAMLRPTSGSIIVAGSNGEGGVDLAAAPERRLPGLRARHFGFVFQDFNLLSALSATENVEYACNLAGTKGAVAHQRAIELLDRFGLTKRARHRPDELSGGERQRVALARALANDPEIILADEPTANLDSRIGHEVGRLLRRLATEDGRCVVVVSHDTRLKDVADQVLWLEDGALRTTTTMTTDPVCGMTVEREEAPHFRHNGNTYWFCATDCREEFAANPDYFLARGSSRR